MRIAIAEAGGGGGKGEATGREDGERGKRDGGDGQIDT